MAPPRVETDHVGGVLADINVNYGDRDLALLSHGPAPCLWRPSPALIAGEAGARPDHQRKSVAKLLNALHFGPQNPTKLHKIPHLLTICLPELLRYRYARGS
jgi:hypothetical protein